MSKILGGQKPPKPIEPQKAPAVPTVDDARAAQADADALDRKRGRAATILTSANGDTATPRLGAAAALGY